MPENIDFLDKIMSSAFSLRKMQQIILEQKNNKIYSLRPQVHVLVISPYGTGKSSITKSLVTRFPKDVFRVDDLTKSALYGSISKNNDYIPSILTQCAGKLMIIDEWNNIRNEAYAGMLSVLENQFLAKTLGFKVKLPFKYHNDYINYKIKSNYIEGTFIFGCIAYAMEFPRVFTPAAKVDFQKTYALLSRFSPIFIDPDHEYMTSIREGDFDININDVSYKVEKVTVTKNCYLEFSSLFDNYITENNLIPQYSRDFGIINRVSSELIRYGIHSFLETLEKDNKVKEIIIDDSKYFTDNFDFVSTLFNNMKNTTAYAYSRYPQFKDLISKEGDTLDDPTLARKLGVSKRTIRRFKDIFKKSDISSAPQKSKEYISSQSRDANLQKLIKLKDKVEEMSIKDITEELNISRRQVHRLKSKLIEGDDKNAD